MLSWICSSSHKTVRHPSAHSSVFRAEVCQPIYSCDYCKDRQPASDGYHDRGPGTASRTSHLLGYTDLPHSMCPLLGAPSFGKLRLRFHHAAICPSERHQALQTNDRVTPGLPNVARHPALHFTFSADKTTAAHFNQEPTAFLVSDLMQASHMPFRAHITSLPVPCGVTFRPWRV